ncbi:hypothetical protein ACNUDN_03675 [Mycobacterium sp. smrl_JER01]|uniref:hypothetical protein n=1 Tax=Mycobacterium sp. smrl_JER01 TaxID=3402633 RepID=UPI003AC89EAA
MSEKAGRGTVLQLVLAAAAAVGCVLSWLGASTDVVVAPVLAGEPSTTSQVYSAPMITLSLLLATAAGVLAVLGISRLRQARSAARARSR